MKKKILIIDDEKETLEVLEEILKEEGYEVFSSLSYQKKLLKERVDVILLDIWLKFQNGIEILEEILQESPQTPVILISGHASIELAIEGMKKGAIDFLEKPLSIERIKRSIENAIKLVSLEKELLKMRKEILHLEPILGESSFIKEVQEKIPYFAKASTPIFLWGERGVGKNLIAKHIIYSQTQYIRGIETFSAGGKILTKFPSDPIEKTFLIREGEKLTPQEIYFLQEKEHSYRWAKDPPFRLLFIAQIYQETIEDYPSYKELKKAFPSIISLHVPPLRKRKEDIIPLWEHFQKEFTRKGKFSSIKLHPKTKKFLLSYPWYQNIYELKNLLETLLLLYPGQEISPSIVKKLLTDLSLKEPPLPLRKARREFEKNYILYVLSLNKGNMSKTAQDLQVERTYLYRKLQKLGISPHDFFEKE